MRNACNLIAVVCVTGCNSIYGLAPTQGVDAAFYDAPIDAPPACPALGTPPRFSRDFEQAVPQICREYTVSTTGRALALCPIGGENVVAEGPIGKVLEPASGFPTGALRPRLSADGSFALVRGSGSFQSTNFRVFAKTGMTWIERQPFSVGFAAPDISAPTRGPNPRVLVVTSANGIRELVDDGNGVWSEELVHTAADLGLVQIDAAHLTADGLRVVVRGTVSGSVELQLRYTDRASVTETFRPTVPMPGIEFLPNGVMTEDCARLYFWDLGRVFYTEPL